MKCTYQSCSLEIKALPADDDIIYDKLFCIFSLFLVGRTLFKFDVNWRLEKGDQMRRPQSAEHFELKEGQILDF